MHAPLSPSAALVATPAKRRELALLATRRVASRTGRGIVRGRGQLKRLASDVGQGTVEYVGLLLLMATILAAIVTAANSLDGKGKIGQKVVDQIGSSIDKAGSGK